MKGKYCCVSGGTSSKTIYCSSDGGKTWKERTTPGAVRNISVTASGTIWMLCGEHNAYFLAKTWVEKDSVVTYSSTPGRIFARDDAVYTFSSVSNNGFYDETMMASFDSGATWKTIFSQKSNTGATVANIAIGKNTGSALIAQTTTSAELRYTTDNGARWETIPLPPTGWAQTWVDCADDSTLFISSQTTIWSASLPRGITGVLPEQPALTNELVIYPNPAAESFTVRFPPKPSLQASGSVSVTVRDVFGRVVLTGAGGDTFSTAGLAAGVYFVEAAAGGRTYHEKVIIHR